MEFIVITKCNFVFLFILSKFPFLVFEIFENLCFLFELCVGMFGVICKINCYFEYRIRSLCIFLYIGTYFKWSFKYVARPFVRKCPRSVNTFRIICGGTFGPKWSSSPIVCLSYVFKLRFKVISLNGIMICLLTIWNWTFELSCVPTFLSYRF